MCALSTRLEFVFHVHESYHLDLPFLQEVRITVANIPSLVAAASKRGLYFVFGPVAFKTMGRLTHGVALLSRWPVQVCAHPVMLETWAPGRIISVSLPRQHQLDLHIIGVYLSASSQPDRHFSIQRIFALLQASAEDFLVIGDWNQPFIEHPIG